MSWQTSFLKTFAKMIGVPEHQAEDALHSERAARATLTRRNLFAAGAALAAGSVFSFPTRKVWQTPRYGVPFASLHIATLDTIAGVAGSPLLAVWSSLHRSMIYL